MQHQGTVELETKRLLLRRFKENDCENVFLNWGSDPAVSRYLGFEPHKDQSETKLLVEKWLKEYDNIDTYHWLIELKTNGVAIGSISVEDSNDKYKLCEVGYALGKEYWHQGYAAEALMAVIEFLFNKVGYECIEGKCRSDNPASGKVMLKCGMQHDATLRNRRIDKLTGKKDALEIYSIIIEDFISKEITNE